MSLIGEAFIKVAADTGGFRRELQTEVEAAASSVEADVEVKADSDGLRGEVTRAAALAGAGQEIDIDLNVEDGGTLRRSLPVNHPGNRANPFLLRGGQMAGLRMRRR